MIYEDYLHCSGYEGQAAHASEAGFSAFYEDESQRHFFSLLDADGKVLLKSEGYPQQAARENGIQSVIKNRVNRDFYSVKSYENGRFYISLRAANYREIARSCSTETEAEALALLPYLTGEQVRGGVVAAAVAPKERADNKIDDDYLICREYAGHGNEMSAGSDESTSGLVKFTHSNGKHYFVWYGSDGDVLMRSEGYPTTAARDNGLASVAKNRNDESRYSTLERMGRYFVILKAGNHQEIARSCPYDSESGAMNLYPTQRIRAEYIRKSEMETHNNVDAEPIENINVPDNVDAEPIENIDAPDNVHAESIVETIAPVVTVAAATTTTVVEASSDVEDDYLPCREYEGRNINDKVNRVALFKHDNGQYYFAIYTAEGNVRLRSEGFRTAQERDVELSGVMKNLNNEEMYSIIRRGDYFIKVLKDKTGREVGRSCLQKDVPPPPPPAPEPVVETIAPVAAIAVAAAVVTPSVVAPADVEDDYLPCKDYEGQTINDKVNNVAMFKHSNGQYYFAIYNANGSVRIRSEGFRTAQDRDKELSGALRNLNNADMYTTIRRGEYYLSVLKDKTGREVGRGCLQKDEPKPVIAPAIVAGAAAIAATAMATPTVEVPAADVEDDYLPCREYISHIDLSHHGYNQFKSERTDKYYFAVVDGHDHVVLRSEGHPTEAEREADMDEVKRNILIKERYEIKQVGMKHHFVVLRNASGKEIARSCAYDNLAAIYDAAPFLAPTLEEVKPSTTEGIAVAATVAAAAIGSKERTVEAATVAPVVEEAAAGGFNWWWLLLPLLALLAWWLFGKGCNKTEVVTPAVTTVPVVPPIDTVKTQAVVPAPAVESCDLNWIFFDFDRADLRAASQAELDVMAAILKKNPDYVAVLRANTDFKGSDAYNEALSGRRAGNSKQYLIGKGIAAARIKTTMNGEKDPIAKNEVGGADTEQGRQFNRRVELYVQDKNGKNICESIPPVVPAELKAN